MATTINELTVIVVKESYSVQKLSSLLKYWHPRSYFKVLLLMLYFEIILDVGYFVQPVTMVH